MTRPMRKVWTKLYKKLGLRKDAEHIKLQQDVKSCEYEDVHVLWEMLKRNDSQSGSNTCRKDAEKTESPFWEIVQWARHPVICHAA